MNGTTARLVFWTPRIICIAFAAFLSIFAADVFDMPGGPGIKVLALLMHLIPTLLVLLALALAWRREWTGAVLFPLLAVLHLVTKWGQLDWSAYAIIDGLLLLLGVLFWMSWRMRTASGATPKGERSVA